MPPWPGPLDKLRIVAGLELATVAAFAGAYAFRVWRHICEAVPDAQTYLRTSVYTAPTAPLRCGTLLQAISYCLTLGARKCHRTEKCLCITEV